MKKNRKTGNNYDCDRLRCLNFAFVFPGMRRNATGGRGGGVQSDGRPGLHVEAESREEAAVKRCDGSATRKSVTPSEVKHAPGRTGWSLEPMDIGFFCKLIKIQITHTLIRPGRLRRDGVS